jgi:hypothetical protein
LEAQACLEHIVESQEVIECFQADKSEHEQSEGENNLRGYGSPRHFAIHKHIDEQQTIEEEGIPREAG